MRVVTAFVLLATLVVVSQAEISSKRIVINVLETENASGILRNVVSAVEYAYKTGMGANGKMILLENELRTMMPGFVWFVTQGATGIAHTSRTFVYMKVVDGLTPYTVQVVAA